MHATHPDASLFLDQPGVHFAMSGMLLSFIFIIVAANEAWGIFWFHLRNSFIRCMFECSTVEAVETKAPVVEECAGKTFSRKFSAKPNGLAQTRLIAFSQLRGPFQYPSYMNVLLIPWVSVSFEHLYNHSASYLIDFDSLSQWATFD